MCYYDLSSFRKYYANTTIYSNKPSCVAQLTCQWEEILQPVLVASWPLGCCEQSCPHRSIPPPGLWAGEPWAAPAVGQSSARLHYSRFCLGKCTTFKQTGLSKSHYNLQWKCHMLTRKFYTIACIQLKYIQLWCTICSFVLPEWAIQMPSLAAISLNASMPLSP